MTKGSNRTKLRDAFESELKLFIQDVRDGNENSGQALCEMSANLNMDDIDSIFAKFEKRDLDIFYEAGFFFHDPNESNTP